MQKNFYCDQHPTEYLTNFCVLPQCLKPLCPDCIDLHNKFHKSTKSTAEIDSIKNIKLNCQKKLTRGIQEIQKILDELENYMMSTESDDQTFVQIKRAKDMVIDQVNMFFIRLEDQYRELMDQSNEKQGSLNQMLESLRHNLNEFEFLQANIEDINTINTIKRVCNLDVKKQVERFRKQIKQTEIMKNPTQVQVAIEQKYLDALQQILQQFAFVQQIPNSNRNENPNYTVSYQQESNNQSHIINQQQIQSVYNPILPEAKQYTSQMKTTNEYYSYLAQNSYFIGNNNVLHYFQVGENNLFVYNLRRPEGWRQLKVTCQKEKIPTYSKSIITPQGDIFLVGGSQDQGVKSKEIFYLDFSRLALVEVGSLRIGRSSHSLVMIPQGLCIIGGYAQGQKVVSECEIFDPITRTMGSLGQLQYPVASPGLCSFQGMQIIKVGGIDSNLQLCQEIELMSNGTWMSLKPYDFNNIQLTSMCCCIQIEENEIMVFGGYNENDSGSSSSFSMVINGIQAIFKQNLPSLPQAEGFWNNTPMIDSGMVYALQNVNDENTDACLEDQRQILIFDGIQWRNI